MTGELEAIKTKWLNMCGPCDLGLSYGCCTHPAEDYRPVMMSLVENVERLRGDLDEVRAELAKSKGARLLSVLFGHHEGAPRPFALQRKDRSVVALGAEFPDGAVALRLANNGGWTTTSEGGADALLAGTEREILWLSDELEPLAETEAKLEAAEAQIGQLLAHEEIRAQAIREHQRRLIAAKRLAEAAEQLVECERLLAAQKAALGEEYRHCQHQTDLAAAVDAYRSTEKGAQP